jgi:hypothetical protein
MDITLNESGLIPAGYLGTIGKLYLKDVPNIANALKQWLGVESLLLPHVANHVRNIGLTAEAYDESDPAMGNFCGFRWAHVTAGPSGDDETNINWDIMVTSDIDGTIQDSNPLTYKLIRVIAYFK